MQSQKGKRKVRLHAKVNSRLYSGKIENVTAVIKGRTDEEVLVVAHLCHPQHSANDNASGCGAVIEVARVLRKLVVEKRLPRPKRTIRFLLVPEMTGTYAYLATNKRLILTFSLPAFRPEGHSTDRSLIVDPQTVLSCIDPRGSTGQFHVESFLRYGRFVSEKLGESRTTVKYRLNGLLGLRELEGQDSAAVSEIDGDVSIGTICDVSCKKGAEDAVEPTQLRAFSFNHIPCRQQSLQPLLQDV